FEPSLQLPVELLHVLLLGLAKYLWRATVQALSPSAKLELAARLTDANIDGLGLDGQLRGGYLVRHAQSLNGKDFRALLMVVPSVLPTLMDAEVDEEGLESLANAWLSSARLAAALYVDSVPRQAVQEFENYIERCINAVYWSCAQAIPLLLVSKPKLHLLLHTPEHFNAFGPLGHASAERFEAFNAIIRSAAIHSNRLRPSRDIANRLLAQQDIRLVLGGGLLHNQSSAGQSLRVLLASPAGKVLQEMYGLRSRKMQSVPGAIKKKRNQRLETIDGTVYRQVQSVTLFGTSDVVTEDSAVLSHTVAQRVEDGEQLHTRLYLVESVLASSVPNGRRMLRALPLWPRPGSTEQGARIQSALGQDEERMLINLEDVVAVINIQHDCAAASCRLRNTALTATQKRSHPGDDLKVEHTELGLYTASLTQLRSSYTMWSYINPEAQHSAKEIARVVVKARSDSKKSKVAPQSSSTLFNHDRVCIMADSAIASTLRSLVDDSNDAEAGQADEQDETLVADDVEFTSPHASTFIANHPLSRKAQQTLDAMIRAFESQMPASDLESSQNSANSFAPLHIIYGFGLMLAGSANNSQAAELAELKNEVKDLKTSVQALTSKEASTFNTKAVFDLAAKIFFSGFITDYAAGNGSTNMEKAGMIYLRKRPGLLGSNGKTIMMSNNSTAWKAVKAAFHQKFTNLRNHVKSRLPLVLGAVNEDDSRNAYETLQEWVKNYGIDITERRVYRVVLLRAMALKELKKTKGDAKLPDNWWTLVSSITSKLLQDSLEDDDTRTAVVQSMERMVQADKAKFGAFEIVQDEAMLKAERELDACVLEAQGFGDKQAQSLPLGGQRQAQPSSSAGQRQAQPSSSASSSAAAAAAAGSSSSTSARPAPRPVRRSAATSSASARVPSSSATSGASAMRTSSSTRDGKNAHQPSNRKARAAANGTDGGGVPSSAVQSRSKHTHGPRQIGSQRENESLHQEHGQQEGSERIARGTSGNSGSGLPSKRAASTLVDEEAEGSRSRRRFSTPDDDDDEREVEKSPLIATRTKKGTPVFDNEQDDDEEEDNEDEDDDNEFNFGPDDDAEEDYGLDDLSNALAGGDHGL
ncbi:hypothetical protein OC842_006208, partial [Tilletia horrida]